MQLSVMRLAGFTAVVGCAAGTPDPKIYTDPKTTILGCTCKEACTTGTLFGCYAQPYCIVVDKDCKNGTAPYSATKLAHYDYCVWPEYRPYDSKTAAQKAATIQTHLTADTASGSYPSTTGLLGVFTESVSYSFDATSDVFTANRTKFIHSVGVVAPFKFVRTAGTYTGLFASGADHGLIRFSAATAPSKNGFPPGAAVKLFRDGIPSANFMAMPSLDNQPCSEANFFAKNFTNHITGGTGLAKKLLSSKFWQASYCPKMVGLSDLASATKAGQPVAEPVFPWHLSLVPSSGVEVEVPCDNYAQGLKNFQKLTGRFFDVYAAATPTSAHELIGYFELTGSFTTSKFGDQHLFFKHQYMEDDFRRQPGWLKQIDLGELCGMDCASTVPPTYKNGCTSPFVPAPAAVEAVARPACPFAHLRGNGEPCPHDI